jgi:hypothetical protein
MKTNDRLCPFDPLGRSEAKRITLAAPLLALFVLSCPRVGNGIRSQKTPIRTRNRRFMSSNLPIHSAHVLALSTFETGPAQALLGYRDGNRAGIITTRMRSQAGLVSAFNFLKPKIAISIALVTPRTARTELVRKPDRESRLGNRLVLTKAPGLQGSSAEAGADSLRGESPLIFYRTALRNSL